MQRLTPAHHPPLPGAGTGEYHRSDARHVHHLPARHADAHALTGPKKQARQLGDDQVAHYDGMSPFTGADLRLGVSY